MADTLSLDTAVQSHSHAVGTYAWSEMSTTRRGRRRRRPNTHCALQLTELHRFTDPAEAAALRPLDQLVDVGYLENTGLGTIYDLSDIWLPSVRRWAPLGWVLSGVSCWL